MPRPAERGTELSETNLALWREGCALIAQMTRREYAAGESARYWRFREIDKMLTWGLVGPHSTSLFCHTLDDPPEKWTRPGVGDYVAWPEAQTWRRALIEATGLAPGTRRLKDY
jgi:hypothetical protein